MLRFIKLYGKHWLFLTVFVVLFMDIFSFWDAAHAKSDGLITVCSDGCDFARIQDAIDDEGTRPGAAIQIEDPLHTEGSIIIHKDIILQGKGAGSTIVQAANSLEEAAEQVFTITQDTTALIMQMTIRHGHPLDEPWSGGAIRNEGDLTLEDCVISHNIGSAGGGIWSNGVLTLVDSTVSHNLTQGGRSHEECNGGGGIKGLKGTITLIDSTVSDNIALGKGAGFHIACECTLVLMNSTISGNQTTFDGGGIYLNGVGEFTNSTIAGNRAKNGGGLYANGSQEQGVQYGLLNFSNTIIADNEITFEKYGTIDCMIGEDASVGINHYNLVEDGSCDAAFSGDPGLAALASNGGKTQSHQPVMGSIALDAVPLEGCLVETDQRGQPRPYGKGCDVGSVELQAGAGSGSAYWITGAQLLLAVFVGMLLIYSRKKG